MENQLSHRSVFSWTAVLAGAIVGVGISFLLNLFNLAMGISSFTMAESGVITIAIGGFIGILIATLVSTFFTGWVS